MQQWFSFGIVLVAILVLAVLLWKSQKLTLSSLEMLSSLTNQQIKSNQTLTNLLLSKDPMTFQGLQAMTNPSSMSNQLEEFVSPLDDESIARNLAERYEKQGLDPNQAYAQDDIDFRTEFGLG